MNRRSPGPLLEIDDLWIHRSADSTALVRGVSLSLAAGESVAVVGESGSGKTLTARAVLGLLPPGLSAAGAIAVAGVSVDAARKEFSAAS